MRIQGQCVPRTRAVTNPFFVPTVSQNAAYANILDLLQKCQTIMIFVLSIMLTDLNYAMSNEYHQRLSDKKMAARSNASSSYSVKQNRINSESSPLPLI
jgi:hypothetical protein